MSSTVNLQPSAACVEIQGFVCECGAMHLHLMGRPPCCGSVRVHPSRLRVMFYPADSDQVGASSDACEGCRDMLDWATA